MPVFNSISTERKVRLYGNTLNDKQKGNESCKFTTIFTNIPYSCGKCKGAVDKVMKGALCSNHKLITSMDRTYSIFMQATSQSREHFLGMFTQHMTVCFIYTISIRNIECLSKWRSEQWGFQSRKDCIWPPFMIKQPVKFAIAIKRQSLHLHLNSPSMQEEIHW